MRTKNKIYLFILILAISSVLSSCSYSYRMTEYYSDDENYEILSGEITKISNFESDLYITIDFSDGEYSKIAYVLISANEQILRSNNFYEEVNVGDMITFTTAPRIFYDSYDLPIVSLSFNNKVYLEFDQGKVNLLESFK